ncbi:hypothetical protein Tco_0490101 [Tanacetum coccineum]
MLNNPLTRTLPKLTGSRNPSDLQLLIPIENVPKQQLNVLTGITSKTSSVMALNDVRTAFHDITAGIRMEYLPMRKWSNLDKKRAWVMVQDIDKQLYQRRLMRNLEKFVGGKIYGKDLRLLERTI